MNLKAQITAIIQHPFFQEAIYFCNTGDNGLMEHLLFEYGFHIADKTAFNSSRLYGANRWLNTCDILPLLKDMDKPDNLDLRLPIPKERHAPQVRVFQTRKSHPKHNHIAVNQLNLFIQVA